MAADDVPLKVFHLTTAAEWAAAQAPGELRPPSLSAEGFVHCSTSVQLAGTIDRHFAEAGELVLLRLDLERMGEELVWEEARPGEVYPHLYRAVAVADVAEVVGWRRGESDLPG
ncbi:MAG: DUF952 domain-containing protein [Acidimicrobiales bacterium]